MIVEGKIINYDSESYAQVEINPETGLIESVGEHLGTPDIKTSGLIFPGFVDVHVHAREDASGKQNYKEDFQTMSEAAINGGVVAVAEMPNNPVAPVDDARYLEKKKLSEKSLVDALLYAGIGPATNPLSFPVPYKAFMGPSVGDLFFTSQKQLEEVIARYTGQVVSFHCEDPELLEASKNAPTHEGQRPAEAEVKAVRFAIGLIEKFKLQGKLCHFSAKEGIVEIVAAKKRGVPVTAEVTPHHLFFDESMINDANRKWLQMNPPLRSSEDRLAVIAALKHGSLDFFATDHAPHTREEKEKGISGVPHLDTYGAFTTWLMKENNFSARDIARVCAYNPGEFVNKFGKEKFGRIEPGFVGSLTIINTDEPLTIRKEDLKTKCAWSPFEGMTFPGRVTHTVIRGKVYEN